MMPAKDYLQEVQKFTSSQYWYSGWRITAGVVVPLVVFILTGWLSFAVPFLWGALFVSLTDTPGPIHHRRNGMVAAILLNTVVALLTAITREYQVLLIAQIIVLGFFLTMLAVYGARAGAVGTLTLVLMLLNLLSSHEEYNSFEASMLIAAGGTWYMMFSLLLHGIRPYRPVEQALGEHLIAIADYVRARASFYRDGADLAACFDRVMKEQIDVRNIQSQTQDLLFKTRRLVSDASPRSRSLMMIYLDSLDLFEETMYSYHNYEHLHKLLRDAGLLNQYYSVVLELAAGLEYIGIAVQMGSPVTRRLDINTRISELRANTAGHLKKQTGGEDSARDLEALTKILNNMQQIANRINRLILFTRMEGETEATFEMAEKISRVAASQPVKFKILADNLTLKSDTFRHALRLTSAIIAGYAVSLIFGLTHSYWVLLTIVTILRPAYVITKRRNVQRVAGTLVGVLIVSLLLWFLSNTTVLLVIMVLAMLLGYSLLRVQYFSFVVFLTIFVVITLYFLNPMEFQSLIVERLVDTAAGSVIAFFASRFVLPVWGHRELRNSMRKMLEANRDYFSQAWIALKTRQVDSQGYSLARQEAIVSLTNLSENFQRMLSEPQQPPEATAIHQFVIANHMLSGYIAALPDEPLANDPGEAEELEALSKAVSYELQCAEDNLRDKHAKTDLGPQMDLSLSTRPLTQLSMIFSIAQDIRKITSRLARS